MRKRKLKEKKSKKLNAEEKQKHRKKDQDKRKNRDLQKNREIRVFMYLFTAIFVTFAVYFIWFQVEESENIMNSVYNKRVEAMASRITRGRILSSDTTVLAQTITDSDGEEIRYYPYGSDLAFVTGYVEEGKTATESMANYYLLTSHQSLFTKIQNDLLGEKDTGDDVVTTINLDLQLAATEAMAGRNGAVVVLQASTGKILAMVSNPGYDPNTIQEDWSQWIAEDNTDANLLNRVTQGLYPPGSTFKLVTLLEFMKEYPDTWQDFTYHCEGVNSTDEYTIRCFGGTAHGDLSITEALVESCNGAFAAIGQMLDPESFTQTCEILGMNQDLSITLPSSVSSFQLETDSSPWTIARTAIGQGKTQMTPLLSAMITAAIANDGVMMKPYLLDYVLCGKKTVTTFQPESYGSVMTEEQAAALKEMMRAVITDGTAASLKTSRYEAAGKTGTAEYITGSDTTHAWFTGFAGEGENCIAVAVILEGAGTGSSKAAPVAAAIFDAYFE
jgi:cell division protein FtsI/penicillin-binding protein 2